MGLDGGTIISRNDVLRGQCWDLSKADDSRSSRGGAVRGTFKRKKLDNRTSKVTRWSTCALSGQPLAAPIVACFLGMLYNKAAVLEWLLARAGHFADEAGGHRYINQLREAGDAFDHLTSLKDVFAVQYAPAPADAPAVATASNGASDPVLPAPYTCPIAQLRCDCYPFVTLRPCGHVFSERALKEAGGDGTCPICGATFGQDEDVVPLLPDEQQLERLRELLPTRRKQKKQKRDKQQQQQQQHSRGGSGEQQPEPVSAAAAAAADPQQESATAQEQQQRNMDDRQRPGTSSKRRATAPDWTE